MTHTTENLLAEMAPHLPTPLLEMARAHLQALEERLRLQRIAKYGPGSEKLSSAQFELLEQEPGVSGEEVAAEAARPPQAEGGEPEPDSETKQRKRRAHPGRQTLPDGLPRVVAVVRCPAAACVCAACGGETAVIGHDESERLEVKRAEYFVQVTRREKRACASCHAGGVATAPLPPAIIAKGIASDAIVIDTLIAKYGDHCPLYRQSAMLARDSGVAISRATLDGWVMQVGESLRPLVEVMARELLAGDYIQADETPVGVQTHDRRGKNHQAYLWQYGRPGGSVVFGFRMGRGREGPKQFLGNYAGILQTDAYAGYNGVGGPGLVHAACWGHARRKFFDAVKLNPDDRRAIAAVAATDALFALDRVAAEAGCDVLQRHERRRREAPALLQDIREAAEVAGREALPASTLGGAARYILALWPRLTRFLDYPALELSNNLAENSMRPVALGRKNWIHLGGPQAAPRIAAIQSVFETCRRLNIAVREYLAAVLPGLADRPLACLPALTPAAWAVAHAPR